MIKKKKKLKNKKWATHPRQKISLDDVNLALGSWQLAISGATNPGVPHR